MPILFRHFEERKEIKYKTQGFITKIFLEKVVLVHCLFTASLLF